MKTLHLSALFFISLSCFSQLNSFDSFKQDTLAMPTRIDFDKSVVLELDSAFLYIDFEFFLSKLFLERKGCNNSIRARRHLINNKIVANQSALYKKQYVVLDSIYHYLKRDKKSDTFYIQYNQFLKVNSPFGDFIPELIDNGQCAVADKNKIRQPFLIRQIGWKKKGSFSSGFRLFFIPGNNKHFWSKWDWST